MAVRETYIWRDGRLMSLDEANNQERISTHYVHEDTMTPIESQLDGKVYDSKSKYYQSLKAAGYEIVGNEWNNKRVSAPKRSWSEQKKYKQELRQDIARAIKNLGGDI